MFKTRVLLSIILASFLLSCDRSGEIAEFRTSLEQEQMQMDARSSDEAIERIRQELEAHQRIQANLIEDIRLLNRLIMRLQGRSDVRLDRIESSILAVHECTQVLPFIERAQDLRDNNSRNGHYCRVVESYERRCLPLDEEQNLITPTEPGIMADILQSVEIEMNQSDEVRREVISEVR